MSRLSSCFFVFFSCLVFCLALSCRPDVGPSPGHIIGLIVQANSNLVHSGFGLCPERMCVLVSIFLSYGRSYRTTFSAKFSSFFFQENQENQENQEAFPKFGNVTEGKIFGTLCIPMFGKKIKYGNIKNCAKKNLEI